MYILYIHTHTQQQQIRFRKRNVLKQIRRSNALPHHFEKKTLILHIFSSSSRSLFLFVYAVKLLPSFLDDIVAQPATAHVSFCICLRVGVVKHSGAGARTCQICRGIMHIKRTHRHTNKQKHKSISSGGGSCWVSQLTANWTTRVHRLVQTGVRNCVTRNCVWQLVDAIVAGSRARVCSMCLWAHSTRE